MSSNTNSTSKTGSESDGEEKEQFSMKRRNLSIKTFLQGKKSKTGEADRRRSFIKSSEGEMPFHKIRKKTKSSSKDSTVKVARYSSPAKTILVIIF
mmetsp:Transcript_31661/g.48190  ORF Transcript_31661/g.48190 Transcript_31661/m.48190 type:complete len:96 (-) Transcript_31661:1054-1341(-)